MNPVLVEVPCRRFKVVVKLGPAGGIGHLESLLLRRLGLGPATLTEVAGLFSLPEPLVLDRIVALFRVGLVVLEPGDQRLHLGPAAVRAMKDPEQPADGWQVELGLAGTTSKEVELLREMVSGTVFSRPVLDRTRWEHRLPPNLELPTVDDIPKPVLLSAASSRLREERTGMRNLRAFDVACVGGADAAMATATPETYDSIVVEVVGFNLGGDHPTFSVIGPPRIGRRVRDAIADGITMLHQRGLADALVAALTARGYEGGGVAPSVTEGDPDAMAASLRGLVDSVDLDVAPRYFGDLHDRAIALARDLDDQLNVEAAHEGRAELIVGAEAHRKLLLGALRDGAQHQVVIASPRVDGLAQDLEMRDALVDAVSRGVRVNLLWGEGRAKFADAFASLGDLLELLQPREQKVGGLFVSKRPSNLHASALAADLQQVCIGRFDWFGVAGAGRQAISVLLPSIASTVPSDPRTKIPTAVVEVVQALRQTVPEANLRRVIVADTVLDGGRAIVRERSPMEFPTAPSQLSQIGVRIWKDDWGRWISDLLTMIRPGAQYVKLIPRGGHRRVLVRAFEQARRRIVVMSPRLGEGALGAALEPYVLRALDRGVDIVFSYREVVPRDDLTDRFRLFRERGLRALRCDLDGGFVVCDDRAIVSSFRFGDSDGERGFVEFGFDMRNHDLAEHLVRLASQVSHDSLTSHAPIPSI